MGNNFLASLMRLQREHPEARVLQMREIRTLVEALVPPEERENREAGEAAMSRVVETLDTIMSERKEIPFDASTSVSLATEAAMVLFLDEPDKLKDVVERLERRDKRADQEIVGKHTEQVTSKPASQTHQL